MTKRKTHMLNCCEKCQNYWTCETKWYRGEEGKENICCVLCMFYDSCWSDKPAKTPRKSIKH